MRDPWRAFARSIRRAYQIVTLLGLLLLIAAAAAIFFDALTFKIETPTAQSIIANAVGAMTWLAAHAPEIVKAISFLLFAIAIFIAALKIETVYGIVKTFNDARSPISDLRTSVDGMKQAQDSLKSQLHTVSDAAKVFNEHAPTLHELNARIAAIAAQIFRLQEDSVIQRADEATVHSDSSNADSQIGTVADPEIQRQIEAQQQNYEELRAIWHRNNRRLDGVIKYKLTGAKQRKYDDMPRSDWPAIMDQLRKHNVLAIAAHEASNSLHRLFMSYSNKKRAVPEHVVGSARTLDAQLDHLIGRFPSSDDEGDNPSSPSSTRDSRQDLALQAESHQSSISELSGVRADHGESNGRPRSTN